MKYLCFFFALSSLLFVACEAETSEEKELTEDITPFNVSMDMTVKEVKELYSDCDFRTTSANSYGLCGGGEDLFEIVRNDTVLFSFWEDWGTKKLGGFILLDPKQSFENLHVGLGLDEYLQNHPDAETTINLISSKECIFLDGGNCWVNLDSKEDNYAAEYNFDQGEAEFVKYIDTDRKIESIFVKSSN